MRYGIPYKGSKSRIAGRIVERLPESENFYDLFCGGCAITHCAMLNKKAQNYIINDIDEGLSQLFVDIAKGKYRNRTEWISREDFYKLRDTDAFIRYMWSFGNNGRDYMYGRDIEPIKKLGHNAIVNGDIKPLEDLIGLDLHELLTVDDITSRRKKLYAIVRNAKVENADQLCVENLRRIQSLERIQNLVRLESFGRLENFGRDYRTVEIKSNSVIYCDIPYKNTDLYSKIGGDVDCLIMTVFMIGANVKQSRCLSANIQCPKIDLSVS